MEPRTPTLTELIDALPEDVGREAEARPWADEPIPTGRLTRLWSLGTLQGRLALAYLAWWLKNGFRPPEERARALNETHLAAALQALDRMSYLRGAVMKLGQVLAGWPDVLPGTFASVLGRLYTEAPPMHFALLREQARGELGADPLELFDAFETTAFAAASLGQVHRARLKGTGQPVAVKIQYPDIARTVRDDLANLKSCSFAMRMSSDWPNVLAQFDAIRTMLERETDYLQEADNLELARRELAGLPDVVVPRVVRELSSRRVLTMELLEGHHLDGFLARRPAQATRDRHGAQIARAVMRLWYGADLVYADPHPGNFLFLDDGRLGLLDLGCCHRFSADELDYVTEFDRAARGGDRQAVVASLARGCALAPEALGEERKELLLRYCDWLWEPLRSDDPFDYGDPEQFAPGVRLYGEFVRRGWVRGQPVNTWLTKVFFGVRALLTHLEARVPYGAIWRAESTAPRRP